MSEAVSKATTLFADLMATPDAMDSADANISASMKEDASSLVVEQLTVRHPLSFVQLLCKSALCNPNLTN